MKTATAFFVAVTVFASVFLESSAAPNVGGFASYIGATVKGLGKVTGDTIKKVGKVADEIVVKASETVNGVIGKLFNGLEAILVEITEAAAALGGEIGEKLKDALTKLQNTFKELIELAEKLLKALDAGADGTVKELYGLFKIVVAKLKADVAGVTEILNKMSERGGNDGALLIATVKGLLAKVEEVLELILSKVAEAMKSKTTEVVDDAKILDEVALGEYVKKEIKTCEDALAALKKFVEEYLATATDEQKEDVAAVVEFLKELVPFVSEIHEELEEAVKVNNREKLEKLIEKILKAIEKIKMQVNELIKTQVDEISEALVKYILESIVGSAVKLVEVVKKSVGIENNAV